MNTTAAATAETGTCPQYAEPSQTKAGGRLKSVWALTIPFCIPANTMVMPSVTMKPLRRAFTMSSPLIMPITAPTAIKITIPTKGLSCSPLP